MIELKNVLTIEEADALVFKTFTGDDCEENLARAIEYAREVGGIVYTQVDSEMSGEVVYFKGVHVVNRTGVYGVYDDPMIPKGEEIELVKKFSRGTNESNWEKKR